MENYVITVPAAIPARLQAALGNVARLTRRQPSAARILEDRTAQMEALRASRDAATDRQLDLALRLRGSPHPAVYARLLQEWRAWGGVIVMHDDEANRLSGELAVLRARAIAARIGDGR